MGRSLLPRRRLCIAFRAVAVALGLVGGILISASLAASDKQLQRIKGFVAYQAESAAPVKPIFGKFLLPDDYYALTRAKSAALLQLPDSSLIGLGENTSVQVGAFNQTAAGPGSTVTVNGGALRFDIRRPVGGAADYHFTTITTQVAVRGTIGLLSFAGGNTTVACIVCAADSITVTVAGRTYTLQSGQVLTVSESGAVVPGALTAVVLGSFLAAGVSTSAAAGPAAATAGVVASGGAPFLAPALAVGGVAGAIAVSSASSPPTMPPSSQNLPTPAPAQVPTPTPTPPPTPTPVPTATASAAVSITGKTRPAAAPVDSATTPRPLGRRP